jgi:hypothetical protein
MDALYFGLGRDHNPTWIFARDGERLCVAVGSCCEEWCSEDAGSIAEPKRGYETIAVICYQGDEAFSGLLEFAEKYHVTSAHFTAIGALNGAMLGWFDPQRKMYKKIPIDG